MRIILVFVVTMFFHISVFAQEMISPEMRNLELNLMTESFASLGWNEFVDVASVPAGVLLFDQAYVSDNSEEFMLIKIAGPTKESRFEKLKDENGTILNFTTRWGNLVSVYIDTNDESKISQIQRALGVKKTSRWQLLIPEAQANTSNICFPKQKPSAASVAYGPMVNSCFWAGWDALKKDVKGKAASIWEAIKNPKSVKHYWNEAKKQFALVKKAIAEITESVPEFIEAMKGLKLSVQTDAVCAWIGSMTPDILATLAAGAGAIKLGSKISLGLTKIKSLSKMMQSFKRAGNVVPAKAQGQLLAGAISCAM